MPAKSVIQDLIHYLRATQFGAEIWLRQMGRRTACFAISLMFLAVTLVFCNIAAYSYMVSAWGPIATPLVLAGANLVLALVAALLARVWRREGELAMARQMQQSALDHLQADIHSHDGLAVLANAENIRAFLKLARMTYAALKRRKSSDKD